jgi:hypothetical protein
MRLPEISSSMLMKKDFTAFAIILTVLLFSGCKPASKTSGEPSLQESQAWMHDFVADRGTGATFEGSGCSATIVWLGLDGRQYLSFNFSLKDLDSNTASSVHTIVSPPASSNMWRATAVTTNNLKKVAVYNYDTKETVQDSVIEGIPFRSSEDADRFAKALRHAIVLCGGKPSPF